MVSGLKDSSEVEASDGSNTGKLGLGIGVLKTIRCKSSLAALIHTKEIRSVYRARMVWEGGIDFDGFGSRAAWKGRTAKTQKEKGACRVGRLTGYFKKIKN